MRRFRYVHPRFSRPGVLHNLNLLFFFRLSPHYHHSLPTVTSQTLGEVLFLNLCALVPLPRVLKYNHP